MVPRKPANEAEQQQEPLHPWEVAKLRNIIERSERILWAWGVVKAAAAGAALIVGTWVLLRDWILSWFGA